MFKVLDTRSRWCGAAWSSRGNRERRDTYLREKATYDFEARAIRVVMAARCSGIYGEVVRLWVKQNNGRTDGQLTS